MAFKNQADKGRILTFVIAGTESVVRPMRAVKRYDGMKYDVITAVDMDTKEIVFTEKDGRPISFKTLYKQGKLESK